MATHTILVLACMVIIAVMVVRAMVEAYFNKPVEMSSLRKALRVLGDVNDAH